MSSSKHIPLVRASWDETARVWYATSEEIEGLVVEAETYDELVTAIVEAALDLASVRGEKAPRKVKIVTERDQEIAVAAA
jgi:hypothetical protein